MFRIAGAFAALLVSASAFAQANYITIEMEIDVDAPAEEVWAKVGEFCDIEEWFPGFTCEITSGDGGVGTVRSLLGGRITEVLVAKTDLSYAYAMPAVEGQPYDMYHGNIEAKPVDANSSRLIYTLMVDASTMADQAAVDAYVQQRRATFEGGLQQMKEIAEAD